MLIMSAKHVLLQWDVRGQLIMNRPVRLFESIIFIREATTKPPSAAIARNKEASDLLRRLKRK